jgi:hypothetical protein
VDAQRSERVTFGAMHDAYLLTGGVGGGHPGSDC